MIEHIRKYANAFKTGDAEQQYLGYQAVVGALSDLYSKMGRLPLALVDGVGSETPGPIPPAAQFAVQGIDGKFLVAIVNPQNVLALTPAIARARALAGVNSGFTPILHNLQSALDVNFDNNSSLVDYGISPQLAYEVQDPNVIRFFRLRSSFDGQNWNPWQIYSSPITCGPVGVQSGLLRTAALTQVNSANTPNVQPLTQHLTTTRIDVTITTNTFGSAPNVTYSSGFVDPGAFGTWFVYCLDPQRKGGTVTYLATLSNPTVTNDDAVVYFGFIVTAGGGGGTGVGGGGGPCCVAEVLSPLIDGTRLPQSALRRGMVLRGVDGGPEPIARIELVPNVPCFRYRSENGLVLRGCSAQHSLQYDGGGFDPAFRIVSGHRLETEAGPSRVLREFIGHRTVYRLCLAGRTKTYIADGFFSHNLIKF